MTQEEIEDSVQEPYELAQTFQTIGDLLKMQFPVSINGQTRYLIK